MTVVYLVFILALSVPIWPCDKQIKWRESRTPSRDSPCFTSNLQHYKELLPKHLKNHFPLDGKRSVANTHTPFRFSCHAPPVLMFSSNLLSPFILCFTKRNWLSANRFWCSPFSLYSHAWVQLQIIIKLFDSLRVPQLQFASFSDSSFSQAMAAAMIDTSEEDSFFPEQSLFGEIKDAFTFFTDTVFNELHCFTFIHYQGFIKSYFK